MPDGVWVAQPHPQIGADLDFYGLVNRRYRTTHEEATNAFNSLNSGLRWCRQLRLLDHHNFGAGPHLYDAPIIRLRS